MFMETEQIDMLKKLQVVDWRQQKEMEGIT